MTTTCDLNVDWNKCPNCARFKERIKNAEEASRAASATLDRAYAGYHEDVAAGRACIATPRQRAWSSYLDDLQMEQSLASSHWKGAIDTWADCIHEHHRRYEARQQEAEDSSKDVAAETEEMVTISKAEAVDELVNIYGGHIDKWLEALRERGSTHTDAGDDMEAAETEGETARELFGELRYGDVPDFDLPDDFEDGSWVSLHSASVVGRVYMILLERYAPRAAKGYPAWVANRLRDVLDEAATQRAITDQEGWK
ncbi:hypothetical protein AH67_05345 [Bifidobacterium pseudolongum PV8-2]|uniref:Uncharacterized protein n=1 Tax=Bifidobacterium pseudolongum PV8-2 TaxID=1447715 RepID=A0A0A7IA03_9BIFI|nr:hypothetical protein [Bifidobacterium pseudolongum]AIZ17072.1 hypothetical protein AH67_05345 [Bifidobacterium pseudolongum PV8-2]